jgi:chromosome segregation ATPase
MATATKTPQTPRATDRVLEALSTLAALLDRSINEVKTLESDFQNRTLQAIQEAEASLQAQAAQHLEEALEKSRAKIEEHFKSRVAEMTTEWQAERERLTAELARMTQTKTQWEAERSRLNTELERLARVQATTQMEAEKVFASMKAASATAKGRPSNSEGLAKEIERIEAQINKISLLIDDPQTDLSIVIRKNVERAELESYLKGIRFSMNGDFQ